MRKLIFKLFGRNFILSSLFIVTFFILGCGITGNAVHEANLNPEVYFCPMDDCGKVLENEIMKANNSVKCALYDLDLNSLVTAFAKKSKEADVRIVMDSDNKNDMIKGSAVRFDDKRQLMHNKFCVIDGSVVTTGSFNPTNNGNYLNNNNMLVLNSKLLSKNYEMEFDELWSGEFGKGEVTKVNVIYLNNIRIENYFCPEDECAEKIISKIDSAKSSIYFMAFVFTSEDIADAILLKENIEVKGIFDSGQSGSQYSQFKRLKDFGIDVKKDTNKYKMHHKVFIIDNETVITGSFNPTVSADTRNDENIIIIGDKEIASKYLEEFENLWK